MNTFFQPHQLLYNSSDAKRCHKILESWETKTFSKQPPLQEENSPYPLEKTLKYATATLGKKVELAERTQIYHTLGFDLLAQVSDQLLVQGAYPTTVVQHLEVNHLDHEVIDQLMRGLYEAAKLLLCRLTDGRISEKKERIQGYGNKTCLHWSATAMGTLHQNPQKHSPKEGDLLIALRSQGFRSHGFSSISHIMEKHFGKNWHQSHYNTTQSWGEALLKPSILFAPAIFQLWEHDLHPHAIIPIDQGGLLEKLPIFLRKNDLGCILSDIFPPHSTMLELQKIAQLSDELSYKIWNMGNGMLLITPREKAQASFEILERYSLKAQVAGEITKNKTLTIKTKGWHPSIYEKSL